MTGWVQDPLLDYQNKNPYVDLHMYMKKKKDKEPLQWIYPPCFQATPNMSRVFAAQDSILNYSHSHIHGFNLKLNVDEQNILVRRKGVVHIISLNKTIVC